MKHESKSLQGRSHESREQPLPIQRILHPTDFSPESEAAFVHALKLAVAARAQLDIVHIENTPCASDMKRFPQVRETLTRWGILRNGATHSDVAELGITVRKLSIHAENPGAGIMQFLGRHEEDLIVLATHHRNGIDRWFHPDIATRIAVRSHVATMFVPEGSPGFVDAQNGSTSLQRVILPVDDVPSPQTSIDLSAAIVRSLTLSDSAPTFSVIHVGPKPLQSVGIHFPPDSDWNWEWLARSEHVVNDIVGVAEQKSADLIAMTTQGHTCWKDILSGCTTENVVQKSPCPVLAVSAIASAPFQETIARDQPTSQARVAFQ